MELVRKHAVTARIERIDSADEEDCTDSADGENCRTVRMKRTDLTIPPD